jgi:hypothetical protein
MPGILKSFVAVFALGLCGVFVLAIASDAMAKDPFPKSCSAVISVGGNIRGCTGPCPAGKSCLPNRKKKNGPIVGCGCK